MLSLDIIMSTPHLGACIVLFVFNLLLQQLSFIHIQTVHSDCSHFEHVQRRAGREQSFIYEKSSHSKECAMPCKCCFAAITLCSSSSSLVYGPYFFKSKNAPIVRKDESGLKIVLIMSAFNIRLLTLRKSVAS